METEGGGSLEQACSTDSIQSAMCVSAAHTSLFVGLSALSIMGTCTSAVRPESRPASVLSALWRRLESDEMCEKSNSGSL